jgi:formylglycine-generating enzyme required for sulfatase activity
MLKTKPDDLDSRLSRAMAHFRLGEDQRALDDLRLVIGKDPESLAAKQYRVIALARLGKKQDALTEMANLQKATVPESSKLYVAAVVTPELGEGAQKRVEALEAAIREHSQDADLRYDAARAFSLASRAVSRSDKARGRRLEERCLQLLGEAVKNDDADFGKMDKDGDLDPIRDEPAFAEIMKAGHPDRRSAAVWGSDATSFEAIPIYGLDPAAHLRKCRELTAQGYRPVSWSLARTTPGGSPVAASVWHRPTVPEEVKDRLAERQARAAVALARMGKAEEVWSLLRHSPDPRLRSFILNWLNPLGADPRTLAAAFNRIDSHAKPTPAPGQQKMDAILFHPETSLRRALILALGTYGTEGLSPGEREPLGAQLLDLYRNDPDAGIHGAAEWTLRKWGQQAKVTEVDAQLIKQKDWSERRWFINGQQQTFAIIEGPVEFRMGSPPTEPKRVATIESRRRVVIPRRFAIAAKEVTIDQWQRFERSHAQHGLPPSLVKQFSPDPGGPMIGFTWYIAAEYCNWLSEQAGLPRDQWCYVPNESGTYAAGMTIPADVLERRGYRLPTEPEWEYACRSGTVTSTYFGQSSELLDKYAWYQANSKDHAWSCGSLLPNDFGLFDMLGNEVEWVQDSARRPMRKRRNLIYDDIKISESIYEKDPRLPRGGLFSSVPWDVRSARGDGFAPAFRYPHFGFRPSRTYN